MDSHDDIRQRLAAVEHLDWSHFRRNSAGDPYYGDLVDMGPLTLIGTESSDPPAERAEEAAIIAFLQHAAADLRRLLTDLDHATTTREAIMPSTSFSGSEEPNPVYGRPAQGEPVRLLADAVEVLRPNGTTVAMDLVALADVAIKADRAVAGLKGELADLRLRVAALEAQAKRTERAGQMLAGGSWEDE